MLTLILASALSFAADETFVHLLEQARAAHESAASFEEWHEGAFGPEGMTSQLAEREQAPDFAERLCDALTQFPVSDYFYVVDYLESHAQGTPCLEAAHGRYQAFLNSSSRRLASAVPRSFTVDARPTLGPSVEYKVDATKTPTLIDGGLPNKVLNLTFDDGPHGTRSPELLKLLRAEKIQVNFFLVGRNTTLYPDIVRDQQKDGHEIGCHSFTHPDMRKLSFANAVAEIEDGFAAIQRALGMPGTFFRFPYGAKTNALRNYLIEKKTPEFYWNIDTEDWKHKDPDFLLKYALEQVRAERHGIVLFHDIQPQTLAIMPAFLAHLKAEGYQMAVFRPNETRVVPLP